jgi:hypothetical protein
MAKRISARLTARDGRRFGLTVGGAFLAFAAIAWWRGHDMLAMVLGAIGGVLALLGLVVPTHLGPVERTWMGLAHAISKITTPIVMGIVYLGVLLPVGLIRRRIGGNPLVHSLQANSFWHGRAEQARRSSSMRRQF